MALPYSETLVVVVIFAGQLDSLQVMKPAAIAVVPAEDGMIVLHPHVRGVVLFTEQGSGALRAIHLYNTPHTAKDYVVTFASNVGGGFADGSNLQAEFAAHATGLDEAHRGLGRAHR